MTQQHPSSGTSPDTDLDAWIAHLAGLPQLRELVLDGLPGVTRTAVAGFREGVRVKYSG